METHLRYSQSPNTIPPSCCHRLCMSDSRQCSASACLLPFRLLLVRKRPPVAVPRQYAAPHYLSLLLLDRLSGLLSDTLPVCHLFYSHLFYIKSIPKPAMDALTNAAWPGNVRELENFIERAVILTQGDELNVPLLELKKSSVRTASPGTFQEAEKQAIIDALKAASERVSGPGA